MEIDKDILQDLIQHANFAFAFCEIVHDKNGKAIDYKYLYVNSKFEELTGLNSDDLSNRKFSDRAGTLFPSDRKRIRQYGRILTAKTTETLQHFSDRYKKWIETRVVPYPNRRVALLLKDITARKEAEQESSDMAFINDLAFMTTDYRIGPRIALKALHTLKNHTKAAIAVYSEYIPQRNVLKLKKIDADNEIVNIAVKIAGKAILNSENLVTPEMKAEMVKQIIKRSMRFSELTEGAMPAKAAQALQRALGLRHFVTISHIASEKLYGTTMLAFREDQYLPSDDLCISYGRLTALSVRRYKAEQELAEKEKKLRRITDNISDVVFTTDLNLNTTYVTPSIEKITGFTPEEHIGRSIEERFSKQTVQYFKKILQEELKKESDPNVDPNRTLIVNAEEIIPGGTTVCLSMHLSFLRDKNGKVSGIQGVARDVSEEIKTKQQLQTVLATIPDLLFHVDKNSRFIDFYQSEHRDMLHLNPEDFVDKTVFDLFDAEIAQQFHKKVQEALKHGSAYLEYELTNDKPHFYQAKYSRLNANEVIAIVSDITPLKYSEHALRDSEEKLRLLLNALGEGVGIVDTNEIFIYANPAAHKIFETDTGELVGRSLYEFISAEGKKKIETENKLRSKGESSVYELEINTDKQNRRIILLTVTPHYHNSKFSGAFGVFRDITEDKHTEYQLTEYAKELKRLNTSKDRFLSVLGHDLRSPFNALMGFSGILAENHKQLASEEVERQLKLIHHISQNTFNLLESLLLWSKSQAGKLSFKPEKLNFDTVAGQISEELSIQAEVKNIRILCEPTDIQITADINMLLTILRNLISNALKFTNKNGTIRINAYPKGKMTLIEIADNGIGMSKETLQQLWDFRSAKTKQGTAAEKGTGFGLIICKEFVEKHGGTIKAESIVGQGSKFQFTIPNGL